jgi:hypothetical protein
MYAVITVEYDNTPEVANYLWNSFRTSRLFYLSHGRTGGLFCPQ